MTYLGMTPHALETAGGSWTAREITQQPAVWSAIVAWMAQEGLAVRAFIDPLLRRSDVRIVLTGAGTSAFVGECLAPRFTRMGHRVDAVSNTDLVSSPLSRLPPAAPILLVSFGRSGNSPESLAALQLAEQAAPACHHLVVTCNAEGALYRHANGAANAHALLLPPETNDRGYAMTSSFTGMLLTAALSFGLLDEAEAQAVSRWGDHMLLAGVPLVQTLAASGYERVVYLGSNECKGLAREAALKMLELTDGRVVALSETPLGFRHGPKTIVNRNTLVIMFVSNDPYTREYELDLLRELRSDGIAGRVVALSAAECSALDGDTLVVPGAAHASDLALCLPYAVFAQTFAALQSLALGLRADLPNSSGVVSRVVHGFGIHPWHPDR